MPVFCVADAPVLGFSQECISWDFCSAQGRCSLADRLGYPLSSLPWLSTWLLSLLIWQEGGTREGREGSPSALQAELLQEDASLAPPCDSHMVQDVSTAAGR